MIKAVIFDLDGTLSDTIHSISHFGNEALVKYGFKTYSADEYKKFVGDGAAILVKRLLENSGKPYDDDIFSAVFTDYTNSYDNDFLYLTQPYDGIPGLLRSLAGKGIKTAVLSNKPHGTTVKITDTLFKNHSFDLVYGQRENIPVKPDPSSLLDILSILGISKDECLYIGDTSTDMQTAKNAGVFKIGVLWGFRDAEDLKDADLIVSHPDEILKFINGDEI